MKKLLIVDDEPGILFTIEQCFEGAEIHVLKAPTAEEGLRLVREESPDVVMLDIRLGSHSGLELFAEFRKINPRLLVIFITGFGTADTAIEAIKLGAFEYLVKPLDLNLLRQTVAKAMTISGLMRVPAIVEALESSDDRADRLVGSSPLMQSVCKLIGRVAQQDVNVLILGDRKSTRLNSSHLSVSRMPSSA